MNRVLTISRTSPHVKSGSGFIMNQFLNFFNSKEMMFLGEYNPEIPLMNKRIFYTSTFLIKLKKGNRFFGWHRLLLIPRLVKKITQVATEQKCNSILCVYPDEIYLIAAFYAAKKLQIPLYPYFHNLYYENKKGLSKVIARNMQRKIFSYSPFVYLVSKGMLQELSTLYPNVNFRILTHSLPKLQNNLNSYQANLIKNNKIILTFLGNVNNSNLDSLKYLINTLEKEKNILIYLITKTSRKNLIKNDLLKTNVILKNNVEDKDVINELNKSNFLLLPHGLNGPLSKEEYRSVFPTKTMHYLQSIAPILSLLPSDSYLHKFLTDNQCAFCFTEKNKEEIISVFDNLQHNKQLINKTIKNANKVAGKFSANNVLFRIRKEILNKF
jgi:hypothetical protein